jgi:hypothetical protein
MTPSLSTLGIHGVLEALEVGLAMEHASHGEERVRLAAPELDHVVVLADHRGAVRRHAPEERRAAIGAERGEHDAGLIVEDDEGEGAGQVLRRDRASEHLQVSSHVIFRQS